MSIYVGNLSFDANSEDMGQGFADDGTVHRVHLPKACKISRLRGVAFV
jgi:RNA recognition motif-containing protein